MTLHTFQQITNQGRKCIVGSRHKHQPLTERLAIIIASWSRPSTPIELRDGDAVWMHTSPCCPLRFKTRTSKSKPAKRSAKTQKPVRSLCAFFYQVKRRVNHIFVFHIWTTCNILCIVYFGFHNTYNVKCTIRMWTIEIPDSWKQIF